MNPRNDSWLAYLLCVRIGALYATSFLMPTIERTRFSLSLDGSLLNEEDRGDYIALVSGAGTPKEGFHSGAQVFVDIARSLAIVPLALIVFGCYVWVANPVLWIGTLLLACGRWKAASIPGGIALFLGLNAPVWVQVLNSDLSLIPGYYLWLGSIGLLAVAAPARRMWSAARG